MASLLARALGDDPAYGHVLADPGKRTPALAFLFERNLQVHLPYRCTRVLVEDGVVMATVTVRPPGGVPVSLLTMVRHGLLPFTTRNGVAATRRLLGIVDLYDAIERDMAPGPHWHVHMMAVEPDRQGRGLGRTLLREVLAETADTMELPTVLTTHKERNVVFYRREGFDVLDTRSVSPGASPYSVWCMGRGRR